MRALVGLLIIGVFALAACNKDNGGGGGAATPGVAGIAGTPQPCNTSAYMNGMCQQSVGYSLVMPGAWPLGAGWSFPAPRNPSLYQCGCPRTTVAAPGQPAYTQEQFGVYFANNSSVACAPIGYFRQAPPMFVGNINMVIQQTAMLGLNPGTQAGMSSPYMTWRSASGYGAYFGANNGFANFRPISQPQMYGGSPYGQGTGVSDPAAASCLNRMVRGCDLALEERLTQESRSGMSMGGQCGGGGVCIPAVPHQPGQPISTLGYCSYGGGYGY